MAEKRLRKAFELMKQGDKNQAMMIVRSVLRDNRESVDAWWLMVNLLDDEDKILKSLNKVLELNPEHLGARKKMLSLRPDLVKNFAPINDDTKKKKDTAYWNKLEERSTGASKTLYKSMILLGIAAFALVIISFVAFNFIADPGPPLVLEGPTPEDALLIQLTAAFNGNMETIFEYTCDTFEEKWRDTVMELDSGISNIGINLNEITMTLANMELERVVSRKHSVVLKITAGELVATYKGQKITRDFMESEYSDVQFRLVVEDDRWVVCST